VRWVAEFRDPWTDNPWKPAHVRSGASDAAERWLERRCLASADRVVAVSDAAAQMFAAKMPDGRAGDVVVVRNGIDVIAPPRPPRAGHVRDAIYVGNLYHQRDPRPFLDALASLHAKGRLQPGLRVRFVGDCRYYRDVSLERYAADHGIADIVDIVDRVPHDECQRMIEASDLLLLLAQDQPAQVPNKLYEYLGARIPILAFVDAGGESETMMRRIGGHWIVGTDASATAIEATVAAALGATPTDAAAPDEALLETWSTERQMDALHDVLENG
jgi:glycosyltransferase involved in cell wall biosynthesis